MPCVYIPIQNSDEEIKVELDQLPEDAEDIIDILKAEQAPLDLWLIIAREYFKQGKLEQFREILREGSSPEIDEYYPDVRYERIAILNALGAYYSYLGKIETRKREKENYFDQATKYYNRASRIDMDEASTWIGKGQLFLAKGDLAQAFFSFKIVLEHDRDNVPALLGQGCVYFSRGSYSDSLKLFKQALLAYPSAPGVRIGIAHCLYKLGHVEKANQAFHRVLEIDPDNIEALVALGILDLQTNEADGIRNGMEKMQRAFDIYPYCATPLNYLANHFFFTGQHFLVEQLTETALGVAMHRPTKAHAYYNLARSYHNKGDYAKAKDYYMASIDEISNANLFALPYYGLGQVQLKFGDLQSALVNFEKVLEVQPENCETLKALGDICVQLEQNEKALELYKKITRIKPRDPQAFLDLGELLVSTDFNAALDAFKTARDLLKSAHQEVPHEVLNYIGVLHSERGEFELASETFKEALGHGIWCYFFDDDGESMDHEEHLNPNHRERLNLINSRRYPVDASSVINQYNDLQFFHQLEEQDIPVELPWYKVSILFNLARAFEQMHITESASILYQIILFKYPEYTDAYLRLATMAKSRNYIQLSLELIGEALKVDENCIEALLMRGNIELKNNNWVKAKETFVTAKDATDSKDTYAAICLGNWNYFAAMRNENRNPKLEATHYEKAKDLYQTILRQHPSNMYAANGAGIVFAERGQFDVAKELFTQVQEAANGRISIQMPDVWINLAHVHFAQGNFSLAVQMYENCARKFYNNTDSEILLYVARTHYEAEQWQHCKKALLRAIHLSPLNYKLRYDLGITIQKFSAFTLHKTKRTLDEVRATVADLKTGARLFRFLSASSGLNIHGFDGNKMETHAAYCEHLLEAATVHCEIAERQEEQNQQRVEAMRQMELAEEAQRKAEEERKILLEKRKQEDELKQVMEQERHLEHIKEQWKNKGSASKRKEKLEAKHEGRGSSKKRIKLGGKSKKKDKKSGTESEKAEGKMEDHEEIEYHYKATDLKDKPYEFPKGFLAALGLDSDEEDNNNNKNNAAPSNKDGTEWDWSKWKPTVWNDDSQRQPTGELDMATQGSDGATNAGDAADDDEDDDEEEEDAE